MSNITTLLAFGGFMFSKGYDRNTTIKVVNLIDSFRTPVPCHERRAVRCERRRAMYLKQRQWRKLMIMGRIFSIRLVKPLKEPTDVPDLENDAYMRSLFDWYEWHAQCPCRIARSLWGERRRRQVLDYNPSVFT
jgi:hypothetical protein